MVVVPTYDSNPNNTIIEEINKNQSGRDDTERVFAVFSGWFHKHLSGNLGVSTPSFFPQAVSDFFPVEFIVRKSFEAFFHLSSPRYFLFYPPFLLLMP